MLGALQTKLLRKDFFEEFCREFAKEMNRLRMEQRAGQSSAKRELVRLEARRKKLVESIMEGVPGSEVKDDLIAIASRRSELEGQLKAATEPPPLLHPSMADLYRTKVEQLAAALQSEDTRLEASETLRGLIESIVLTPEQGPAPDRAERESGRDVDRCPNGKEVARNRRPLDAGTTGCGGGI